MTIGIVEDSVTEKLIPVQFPAALSFSVGDFVALTEHGHMCRITQGPVEVDGQIADLLAYMAGLPKIPRPVIYGGRIPWEDENGTC